MSNDKRQPFGIWIKPKQQVIMAALMGMPGLILGLSLLALRSAIAGYATSLHAQYPAADEGLMLLAGYANHNLKLLTFVAFFFAATGTLAGVLISHRLYGPIVQFRHHVRKLAAADYTSRIKTRLGDEFKDLAGELNHLAEILQKKSQ